jgi:hypothetical protein
MAAACELAPAPASDPLRELVVSLLLPEVLPLFSLPAAQALRPSVIATAAGMAARRSMPRFTKSSV